MKPSAKAEILTAKKGSETPGLSTNLIDKRKTLLNLNTK